MIKSMVKVFCQKFLSRHVIYANIDQKQNDRISCYEPI